MSMEESKALEIRMDKMEQTLVDIQSNINRLVQGIFGDEKLNFPGLLKSYDSLQGQIDKIRNQEIVELRKEIEELKKVNTTQDVEIAAKKGLTDDVVKWLSRAVWGCVFVLVLTLLLTGKIGIADLIKGIFS